jgi:O-acetyl-ADP-ribose deacetylase (regulator of RNase III)
MGNGLELEFKERFPDMLWSYKALCNRGEMMLGRVRVVKSGVESPPEIILFPTKYHWRQKSRLVDIRPALEDMNHECNARGIETVALPAVGCGLGGLEWRIVREVIKRELSKSPVQYIAIPPVQVVEVP